MSGFVTYTDLYAENVTKACACGPWQEGLADGRYAWNEANVLSDPFVKEKMADARWYRGCINSDLEQFAYTRLKWKKTFIRRCQQNGVRVNVNGPSATISSVGAQFIDGDGAFKTFAKRHGLDYLPVKFLSLGEVAKVLEIPIFEAEVDQVPLVDDNVSWTCRITRVGRRDRVPNQVFIVGRLDLPLKPKPIERVVDTIVKAKNLARRIETERPRLEQEAADRKAEADEAAAIAFASESRPDDEAAVLAAF